MGGGLTQKELQLLYNHKYMGIFDERIIETIIYGYFEVNGNYNINKVIYGNFNDVAYIYHNNIYIDYNKLMFAANKFFNVLYTNICKNYKKICNKIHIINYFILMVVFHEVMHIKQLQDDVDIKMSEVFQEQFEHSLFSNNFQFNYHDYLYYEQEATNFGFDFALEYVRNNDDFSDIEVFLFRYIAINNIYSCYKNNSDIFEKLLEQIYKEDYSKKYTSIMNFINSLNLSYHKKINCGFPIFEEERERLNKIYLLVKHNKIDRTVSNSNIL